ncbi:NADH:flavorubredoxin reductase NorW [Photobacterium kishitanii]|uniref:NADH:flavorubredoxin reductase NorW n=1 Tax=Photobacterium kishitanii TaxID=318456 RepID=UPI000D179648|nr:NADH:flavorubredoxin reductase NorW [Photobacterium kishitanii]PSU16974.1 NADH:flavorubredoxin reductase NorW [Photobacterium kishitanii]PSV17134.1 NADH:flavorubredoxin reductase NorW [Photobacterium kishitanii]
MSNPIIVIGSGFAAYQWVKSFRKLDQKTAITLITADQGADYSKPELSHVFSRGQQAIDLIKQTAIEFATEYNIELITDTVVEEINTELQWVRFNQQQSHYSSLIIATGAKSFVPNFEGNAIDKIITLNSLDELTRNHSKISTAKHITVLGAGLIGTEIAIDLATVGKQITLCDKASVIMPTLLPEFIAAEMHQVLIQKNIDVRLNTTITEINTADNKLVVSQSGKEDIHTDIVIAAMGLTPQIHLAHQAGISTNRGIIVDNMLQTSAANVYALGDCAEINGKISAFIQPIMLSALALAKTLAGTPTPLSLPPMLIKAKTPWLPLSLAGITTAADIHWHIERDNDGYVAKAHTKDQTLIGFIVAHNKQKQAFPLLRQLPSSL